MRRSFLALAASAALARPASAEPLTLPQISRYLESLTTAQARFRQVSEDGYVATGTLFLHRPGRARFEYDAPEETLVMAGGGQVAIFDSKSNQPPEQYPIRRTPLSLILDRRINLVGDDMVVGHYTDGELTSIVAQDPENPEYGSIEIFFADDPVRMVKWITTDGGGFRTTVELGEFQTGMRLSSFLFSIKHEVDRRAR
ncbi:MAG: outer membrane lipoprotein carrier protein LolA [Rhodobacteraceae bacterium]|nr:outer membrane lipoprotein carrier protein LolA [Paracoccaceae bacterium]